MKFFFGAFLMLADIVLGVYVGLWVCFIGGIVDIINQLKGSVDALTIAWGIIKICCSTCVGVIVAGLFIAMGVNLMEVK